MKFHKTILTIIASAIILGLGANIQPTQINASRHVHTYRVHRHKIHRRHFRYRRHSAKKVKRGRRSHRHTRVRRRYHVRRSHSHRNMFSYFTKKQLKHMAKEAHEPLKAFKQDAYVNSGKHIYGHAKVYNLMGSPMIFTKAGLRYFAKLNHKTVSQALRAYKTHKTSTNNSTSDVQNPTINLAQFKDQTIQDINSDREANGLSPYSVDSNLSNIAYQRATQLPNDFSHDNAPSTGGENIAYVTLGNTSINGDPKQYDNHNGKDMANEVEDSFINYDQIHDNAHRDNILDNGNYNYSSLGVGTYTPDGNSYYVAEEFQ